jgi:hypothetical protein
MLRLVTLAVLSLAGLAACSGGEQQAAAPAAPPAHLGPPAPPGVWAVEVMAANERTVLSGARVCDDGSLGPSFARALPMVGKTPCTLTAPVTLNPDLVTATCRAGGVEYVATTDPVGELGRIFTLAITLKPVAGGAELKQTVRVRRVGDCPADWAPGDSAAPDSPAVTNVLTGATKTGTSVR